MCEKVPELSVAEVRYLFDTGVRPKFIDARDPTAPSGAANTMIPGATHVPLEAPDEHVAVLPRDLRLIAYGAGDDDSRAAELARVLADRGFAAAYLRGGFAAWLAAGLPVCDERRTMPTNTASARAGRHGRPVSDKELTVQTRQAGASTILDVSGRVTIHSSCHLRLVLHAAVAAGSPAGIVIDCTGTTYLDTSGAATLIDAALLASDRGVPLRVVGLSGQPRLLAEVIDLDRILLALGSEVESG